MSGYTIFTQLSLVLIYSIYIIFTSNPYPPPRLILFPVSLVAKNDSGRVKNKEIHFDIAKEIWPTTLSLYIIATASDDEEVTIDDSLAIKSISEAMQLVDQITCFTRQYEDGEINESLEVVTEKLQDIMIRHRQQKKITVYLNL